MDTMPIHLNKRVKIELKQVGFKRNQKYAIGGQYEDSRLWLSPGANENRGSDFPYSLYNSKNRFSHSEVPERNGEIGYLKESIAFEVQPRAVTRPHFGQHYENDQDTTLKRPVTADYK